MKLRLIVALCALSALAGTAYLTHSLRERPRRNSPLAAAQLPARSFPVGSGGTTPAATTNLARQAAARTAAPPVNPYAAALHEPGKSKRPWDVAFLQGFKTAAKGTPIRFELTSGKRAAGSIEQMQFRDGQLTYLSGTLTEPEPGKFFFLTPPPGSKAGVAAGVVEFWGSQTAYRLEPTGPNGEPELWQRRLDEVLCLTMPLMDAAAADTNDTAEIPPLRPDAVPDYVPNYNTNQNGTAIISLQSYPGSPAVLLLDFFGGYTPTWGGVSYPAPNVSNAQIKDLWKRVAEDFMPFNINVTTDLRVYQNAPASSRQKCVFTPSTSAMPSGAAGVAYIGSWNWGSDTVCWSIYTSGKAGAEVGAHEPGHTLGLGHQGTSTSGYFGGHGSGATGWAPIMGAGYYDNVTTWAKGQYQDANNTQDELSVMLGYNNVDYRVDDTGSNLAGSRYLEIYTNYTAFAEGVIETTGDTDAFQFTTSGGAVSLTANPVGNWADLAVMATLADATDTIIASNNPQTVLSATITTNLPAGTYTFRVTGAGRLDPLTTGFTAYGSLGYYSVTGSVAAARLPTRLSVAEHSPNGTVVGVVPANPAGSSLAYSIVSGNTGGTFSIDPSGTLRVANNTLLDYNRLATNSMYAVQFELFVNITNLLAPASTELNRRVVVSVLNLNDAPAVAGFNSLVLEHTQLGTVLGAVKVTDPDFSEILSYTISAGNSNGMFAIDPTGAISVAGDLNAATQPVYNLAVTVTDDFPGNPMAGTGYVTVNVIRNLNPFQPGSISYALYDGIGNGTLVTDLTGNARWPRDPSAELQMPSFEGLINRADNFGAAMRGYLIPPLTGAYTFWIASDDSGELWMNTAGTNTASLTRLAYVTGYTGSRQWTKFASQKSVALNLTAGQAYYIEARMKEGGGGDNLAVAWKGPATANQTNVIAGLYLAPCFMNYVPHATGFTATLHQDAFAGTALGALGVSDVNDADSHSFTITSGNAAGLFGIDPRTGVLNVANETALAASAPATYSLQVTTTDSGSPPLSATATVTVKAVAPGTLTTSLKREIWNNIGGGTAVSDLTNNAAFPRRPDELETLTSFASVQNTGDNYGSRIRALLTPASSGAYRFFISSDDASTLFLSTDATPARAVRIASVSTYTSANTWTTYASQTSAAINLLAGQSYYIEALQKEGGGGDHVEVAWAGPGIVDTNGLPVTNIIAGNVLAPCDLNYPPVFNNQSLRVLASAASGNYFGKVSALDSPLDTLTYKIVAGNTNNTFTIEPASGALSVADNTLIASGAVTNFSLVVAVQDSGYGGLYPSEAAQATLNISVAPTNIPFVWTGAGMSNNWSDPGNWAGGRVYPGVRLTFGAPQQQANFNDTTLTLGWVQFTNGGFTLSGQPVTLQAGLTNSGNNTWGLGTTLAAPQTWLNSSGTLTLSGALTNAAFPFTLVANGDIRVSGSLSGSGTLNKSGSARLLLQGAHRLTGTVVVAAAGTTTTALEVNGNDDLDLSGADLTMNGRMDLWNHNATLGALNGTGLIFGNSATRTLVLGANQHSGSFSGSFTNSTWAAGVTLGLVKVGAGTQTLFNPSFHTGGTTVSNGALNLAGAGTVFAGPITVAQTGTLTVDTSSTHKTNANPIAGSGLLVKSGVNNFVLQGSNAFAGVLQVTGGYLVLDALNAAAGQPALNLAGGNCALGNAFVNGACTLSSLAGTGAFNTAYGATAGTRTLAVNQTATTTYSGVLADGGGGRLLALLKSGPGSLTLNGANSFTGPTTIAAGTLALGPNGSLASSSISLSNNALLDVSGLSSGWALGSAQSLQGAGRLNGTVTINGTLRPGGACGTLSFTGPLTLSGTTVMEISKSGPLLTNDQVRCSGLLTLGGTLVVTNLGPDALAAGDSFQLFDAASFAAAAFASLALPPLPPRLLWDSSNLAGNGTLRVVAAEPAAPPRLVAAPAGGTLTLSWPGDYTSYVLQVQTNPAGAGLGAEWYPVDGVTNNAVVLPLDLNVGSAFYRLVKP